MSPPTFRPIRAGAAHAANQGQRLRVLVVDDSVVMRRLVSRVLEPIPELELVGSAGTGKAALDRIPQLKPDLITLDIEMPEMDGLTAARAIRERFPSVRIIMCSTLTQRGAAITLEALASGADDYVTKPSGDDSLDVSIETLRGQLVPKVRQFLRRSEPAAGPGLRMEGARIVRPPSPGAPNRKRDVVAVASSTGGPVALSTVIPGLPRDFHAPILVVQHMPPMFTSLLAERLNTQTHLRVVEAKEGMLVERGAVYIAPGDYHMVVRRAQTHVVIGLTRGEPENSCRPAADVLFRSVAEVYGPSVVGVVLTGMGNDGMRGAAQMRQGGAWVVAQDEASSVVWGMPGSVVGAGLADRILPLADIPSEISLRFAGRPA